MNQKNTKINSSDIKDFIIGNYSVMFRRKDLRWSLIWLGGMILLWIWNLIFIHPLSYSLIQSAIFNTFLGAIIAVFMSLLWGWSLSLSLYFLESSSKSILYLMLVFIKNVINSIPQIIGLLVGYLLLTLFVINGIIQSTIGQILWMAFVISVFCSIEVCDLISERISFFRKSDYFNAMLCCGIKESRIINKEVLWKSSMAHITHKTVSLFGVVILLQCSIDFIISVGLSTDVSLSNFPVTLGSLLAKLDSKQDILALGLIFTDFTYITKILFQHLQGVSVAFIIVFTLLCVHYIADGIVKEYDL